MIDHPLHVIVKFGSDIPVEVHGPAMMALEKYLRQLAPGVRAEVFKEAKGDDSKPRMMMTKEQRAKL